MEFSEWSFRLKNLTKTGSRARGRDGPSLGQQWMANANGNLHGIFFLKLSVAGPWDLGFISYGKVAGYIVGPGGVVVPAQSCCSFNLPQYKLNHEQNLETPHLHSRPQITSQKLSRYDGKRH